MASVAFLQVNGSATDLTTYTFSAENLGVAASDRFIVVTITGRSSDGGARTIDTVTIGGVTATINIQIANSGSFNGIATAAVPTGTTGDIVITWSGTMGNCDIGTYRAIGLSSATAANTATSTATPTSAALTINSGGIGVGIGSTDAGAATATWTNMTEDFDADQTSGNDYSGASTATDGTPTITCDWTTETRASLALASFDEAEAVTFTPTVMMF